MTRQAWNARRWVLRFDELGHYLATKDNARAYAPVAKARPDSELVAQWLLKNKVTRCKGRASDR